MEVWQDGQKLEVERSKVCVTDRTRGEDFAKCPRRGFYTYFWEGTGVVSSYPSEDPEMGTATHLGLGEILTSRLSVGEAGELAFNKVMEGHGTTLIQGDELFWRINPELAETLLLEQASLARILVEAWGRRRADDLARNFNLWGVEEEINWRMGDGVVMMSRLDGSLEHEGTLYVLSFKTTKQLDTDDILALATKPQNWSECYALQHRYGKPVGGVLYHELMKGKKYPEERGSKVKRYTTGLVRPWYNSQAGMGSIAPQYFSFQYEWPEADGKKSRLGKAWERVNIWEMMPLEQWIDWLDEGLIDKARGRDFLLESTATPELVEFKQDWAQSWLTSELVSESQRQEGLISIGVNPSVPKLDKAFRKNEHSCFYYGYKCKFFDTCFGLQEIEDGLASGRYKIRTPNHPQEEDRNV